MTAEIRQKKAEYVRIHDSGDFYSRKYLYKWIEIMKQNPEIRFYAYTNMVQLMKEVELPGNFDVTFSDSGKQRHLIDKRMDKHTRIFKSKKDLDMEGYTDASKLDLYATKWFNKTNKVGLIYH